MVRIRELDAVTLDAFGTLVRLTDPLPTIEAALRERGIDAGRPEIAAAFAEEGRYYRANTVKGRDADTIAELDLGSADVFLSALGVDLDRREFAPVYAPAFRFELEDGVPDALASLREAGIPLAVVANWDVRLHAWLDRLGIAQYFSTVVTAAEAGTAKPDPAIFRVALGRLGVQPERALHIGDDEVDDVGARAAGMHFAYAPLAQAVEALL